MAKIRCSECLEPLDESMFHQQREKKSGRQAICKLCMLDYQEKYRDIESQSGCLTRSQITRWRLRSEALKHYGGDNPSCKCCGESFYELLSIDHINGGGAAHRKEIGQGSIYSWLKRNNYPEGFRVLCHNCNQAIGHYGYCPHNSPSLGFSVPDSSPIQNRTKILEAAKKLHASGVYPSMRKIRKATGFTMGIIARHRTILIQNNKWPEAAKAIAMNRKYRPDIHGKENVG